MDTGHGRFEEFQTDEEAEKRKLELLEQFSELEGRLKEEQEKELAAPLSIFKLGDTVKIYETLFKIKKIKPKELTLRCHGEMSPAFMAGDIVKILNSYFRIKSTKPKGMRIVLLPHDVAVKAIENATKAGG